MDDVNGEIIWQDSQYIICRVKPSLFNLVPTKLRPAGIHEKLRWLVQYFYGYWVYVFFEKTSVAGGDRINRLLVC